MSCQRQKRPGLGWVGLGWTTGQGVDNLPTTLFSTGMSCQFSERHMFVCLISTISYFVEFRLLSVCRAPSCKCGLASSAEHRNNTTCACSDVKIHKFMLNKAEQYEYAG